jgi:hypothetical protein
MRVTDLDKACAEAFAMGIERAAELADKLRRPVTGEEIRRLLTGPDVEQTTIRGKFRVQ